MLKFIPNYLGGHDLEREGALEGHAITAIFPIFAWRLMEIADENLPSSVDREQRHLRNPAFVSRDVAVDTIVVPICKGVRDLDSAYTFNSLSRSLWLLLEEGCTTEELANWVATHHDVLREQTITDIRGYLTDLQEIDLIRTV